MVTWWIYFKINACAWHILMTSIIPVMYEDQQIGLCQPSNQDCDKVATVPILRSNSKHTGILRA